MLIWLRDHRIAGAHLIAMWWRWYANTAGIAVVAFGAAIAMVWGLSEHGPIFEQHPTIKAVLHTPKVEAGGTMRYTVHTRMNQSCPGDILMIFTATVGQANTPPAIITTRRPITRVDLHTYRDFPATVDLPESLTPGHWVFTLAADTRCPFHRRTDTIAQFPIEVTP